MQIFSEVLCSPVNFAFGLIITESFDVLCDNHLIFCIPVSHSLRRILLITVTSQI